MTRRMALFVMLLTVCGLHSPAAAAQHPRRGPAPSQNVMRLSAKLWRVSLQHNPACAAAAELPACRWQRLETPSLQLPVDLWQRAEITLAPELRTPQQLGLLVQGSQPVYEVFINGERIGGSGSMATRRGPHDARAVLPFSSALAADGRLVITLHTVDLVTSTRSDGFTPALGPVDEVRQTKDLDTFFYLSRQWQRYICYLMIFCAGFVFLILYALDRRSPEYLWLGLQLTSLAALRLLEFASVIDLRLPSALAYFLYIGLNAIFTTVGVEFAFSFVRRPVWPIFRVAEVIGFVYGLKLLLLLPFPQATFIHLATLSVSLVLALRFGLILGFLARLVPLRLCFTSRLPEMPWIGVALAFIAFEGITRQLSFLGLPSVPQTFAWATLDFDLLASAYLSFAAVMLVAMTVRFRRIQGRNQAIEQEIAAAAAVQQLLLASAPPASPEFIIETAYLPAGEVGGDFFHVIPDTRASADGSLLVLVGDVSGKGIQAAMTVSTVIGAVRDFADRRPLAVLEHLNRVLVGQIKGFTTCCVTHIAAGGAVAIANAGHLSPYRNGAELPLSPGLPLGVAADAVFAQVHASLAPRDRLTFVSDGVVEAMHASTRELFGFDRVAAISTQPAQAIAQTARAFGSPAPQTDDITVFTIIRV